MPENLKVGTDPDVFFLIQATAPSAIPPGIHSWRIVSLKKSRVDEVSRSSRQVSHTLANNCRKISKDGSDLNDANLWTMTVLFFFFSDDAQVMYD